MSTHRLMVVRQVLCSACAAKDDAELIGGQAVNVHTHAGRA
jgi:hypothetical protein